MSGYTIFVHDDISCTKIGYDIENIECTVDEFFDIIKLSSKLYLVNFGTIVLNSLDPNTPLADMGLGSECTINVLLGNLNKEESVIVDMYSIEALNAYYRVGYNTSNLEYFDRIYYGYFENKEAFLKKINIPQVVKDKYSINLLYNMYGYSDFNIIDNHYFWKR